MKREVQGVHRRGRNRVSEDDLVSHEEQRHEPPGGELTDGKQRPVSIRGRSRVPVSNRAPNALCEIEAEQHQRREEQRGHQKINGRTQKRPERRAKRLVVEDLGRPVLHRRQPQEGARGQQERQDHAQHARLIGGVGERVPPSQQRRD